MKQITRTSTSESDQVVKSVLALVAILLILLAPIAQVRAEEGSGAMMEWSGVSTLGAVTKLGETGGITESGYHVQFRDLCSKSDTECYLSVAGVPLWLPY